MKSLMMENKTLRVHRESMLEDSEGVEGEGSETRTEVSPARQNPVQTRATSMIEMRGSKRNTTRMVCLLYLYTFFSVDGIEGGMHVHMHACTQPCMCLCTHTCRERECDEVQSKEVMAS